MSVPISKYEAVTSSCGNPRVAQAVQSPDRKSFRQCGSLRGVQCHACFVLQPLVSKAIAVQNQNYQPRTACRW